MKIRGVDLHIQIKGEGTPFIWAHGLMSSIEGEDLLGWFEWDRFPANIQLVRYDARGHGKSQPSPRPEDYHWKNLGLDMLAIADAVGAKQFIGGGMSMGCATAIYAAIQAPDRIKALVLVLPPTAWETRSAQAKLYRRFATMGLLLGGGGFARMMAGNLGRMLPAWLLQAEQEKLTAGMPQGLRVIKRKALWNIMRGAASTDLPPREEISALTGIPITIIAWVGDPTHPLSTAEELHRLLPQSELFIAQGYEEFKTVPQRIRDFVSRYAG